MIPAVTLDLTTTLIAGLAMGSVGGLLVGIGAIVRAGTFVREGKPPLLLLVPWGGVGGMLGLLAWDLGNVTLLELLGIEPASFLRSLLPLASALGSGTLVALFMEMVGLAFPDEDEEPGSGRG